MWTYMDDWDDEYERELRRRDREAEENGEEFDEDEWRRKRFQSPEAEIDEAIDEASEEITQDDEIDEAIEEAARGTEETEERDYYDGAFDSSSEEDQEPDKKVCEYPEDPWAEDEHRQRNRKGSGGHNSNNGLRQAEQNAGDFYNYAYMEPEDGHGISVPQLTAFDKDDDEKVFRKPEKSEDRRNHKMERVSRKYEKNEEVDDEFGNDGDEHNRFDEWVDSTILSSPDECEDEYEAEERLTDYEDDIMAKAEERVLEFYANGGEEEHFRRLRDDSSYGTSPDREIYNLHRELKSKLEMYEDRMADNAHDNTYYLPHVHGALEAINDARHLCFRNRKKKEELKDMHESGDLSDMQYAENEIALDHGLRRQLTGNQYKAIAGGNSMFEDVGEIMDHWNNLVDDTLSGDEEKLQDARNFISQLPREVADQLIDDAVDDGLIDRSQADHFMTMSARPTNSLTHPKKSKTHGFADKAKRFFRL